MLIEMQSRIVAHCFAGKMLIPCKDARIQQVDADQKKQKEEFPCHSDRLSFLVDPYDYMNQLATLIHANVLYLPLLKSDPFIVYCLLFDSWNPFALRLRDQSPEKREMAREMILRYHDHPTSKKIRDTVFQLFAYFFIIVLVCVVLGICIYKNFRRKSINTR